MANLNFHDLEVWKYSMQLARDIYSVTGKFPQREQYGITSQIQRAAVSIPSNIAEGVDRKSTQDFIRFLNIANGSLAELETQLILSLSLTYISEEDLSKLSMQILRIRKMVSSLKQSLQKKMALKDQTQHTKYQTPQ